MASLYMRVGLFEKKFLCRRPGKTTRPGKDAARAHRRQPLQAAPARRLTHVRHTHPGPEQDAYQAQPRTPEGRPGTPGVPPRGDQIPTADR